MQEPAVPPSGQPPGQLTEQPSEAGSTLAAKKPIHKKWWFWAIIAVLAFWAFSSGGGDEPDAGTASEQPAAEAPAEPVADPAAEPEPQETLTAAEKSYAEDFDAINESVVTSMGKISEIFSDEQQVLMLLMGDEETMLRSVIPLVGLQNAHKMASDMTPPSRFEESHEVWLEGLDNGRKAADNIIAGIDDGDTAKIEKATSQIQKTGELLPQAQLMMMAAMP